MASAFARDLRRYAERLGAAGEQSDDVVQRGLENIARATAAEAARLTPRSDGAGPHLADAWRSEVRTRGSRVEMRVFNDDPRANAPIPLRGGGETTLLRILEFGSRPHSIEPRNAKALRFTGLGGVVFAKRVEHPGTRAYGMLRLAEVKADIALKQFVDALRKALVRGTQA